MCESGRVCEFVGGKKRSASKEGGGKSGKEGRQWKEKAGKGES